MSPSRHSFMLRSQMFCFYPCSKIELRSKTVYIPTRNNNLRYFSLQMFDDAIRRHPFLVLSQASQAWVRVGLGCCAWAVIGSCCWLFCSMLHGGICDGGVGVARSGVCLYILGSEILTDNWKINYFSNN